MFRRARELKEEREAGHETRDLSPRGIAAFGCIFLVAMGLILVFTTGVMSVLSGKPPQLAAPGAGLQNAPGPTPPAGPVLDAVPGQNYQLFLTQEDQILNSYGWVDQKTGVVRIPIDRAMQLILQRGLPSRPASESQNAQDNGNQIPSTSSSGRMMEKLYH